MGILSSTNPLFVRLTQNAKGPSLRTTLLLTIGVSLVSTLLATYWLSTTESLLAADAAARQAQGGALAVGAMSWSINPLPPALRAFLFLPGTLLILTPIVLIGAAVITSARALRDKEAYQQLRQALSPQVIVRGLMLATLHRIRFLWALTVVLMPFLVISPYQENQAAARYHGCYVFITPDEADLLFQTQQATGLFSIHGHNCTDPSDSRFLLEAIFKAVISAIISWGTGLFGLTLAVGLMLWRRRVLPVVLLLAAIPSALAILSLAVVAPALGPMTTMCTNTCTYLVVWPPHLANLVWPLVPYALAWGCAMLARRWA